MRRLRLPARVSASGSLELVEPLPEEFRSTNVEILVVERDGSPGDTAWDRLAIESFFEDEDERDAVYDSL